MQFSTYALVVFLCAVVFFAGFHNVDLMMNACSWVSEFGISCFDIRDENAFMTWSYVDGYKNGVTMMVGSFLVGVGVSVVFACESRERKLGLIHNCKCEVKK